MSLWLLLKRIYPARRGGNVPSDPRNRCLRHRPISQGNLCWCRHLAIWTPSPLSKAAKSSYGYAGILCRSYTLHPSLEEKECEKNGIEKDGEVWVLINYCHIFLVHFHAVYHKSTPTQ